MIEKLQKLMNNVIDRLIKMSESCQTPSYLNNYLRTTPEIPGYPNSELSIDSCKQEMARSVTDSKTTQLEEKPALLGNIIGDEVLAAQ